jgi:SAM-dependent methyltransferase
MLIDKGCTVVGVEPDPRAAEEARRNGLDVHVGSIENRAFRDQLVGPFDVVIAADVLEHLVDPAPVLDHFKQWLAPGGKAIIALPNLATWEVRSRLFFSGHFEYTETGIMDRTHVHFFTWDSFNQLAKQQGWATEAVMFDGWNIPGANKMLVELPIQVLNHTRDTPPPNASLARLKRNAARYVSARLLSFGKRVSTPLVDRFPNLCAPHFALLLSPPRS